MVFHCVFVYFHFVLMIHFVWKWSHNGVKKLKKL